MKSSRALFGILTAILVLAIAAATAIGFWQLIRSNQRNPADSPQARQIVLDAARANTVKLLSYTPQNVETALSDAATHTTGKFRDSYTRLTHDVVIPGAQQKKITAVAEVPAAAVESLSVSEAVLIVFINQTVTVASEKPTETASSVRMRMKHENDSWLVAQFDPL